LDELRDWFTAEAQRSLRKILFIQSRSLRDWIKTLQAFGHKCSYRVEWDQTKINAEFEDMDT